MDMSHSRLLKFTFTYGDQAPEIPLIPLHFIDTNNNATPTFNAILDSGADEITIPKELADFLGYTVQSRTDKINTAGGEIDAFKSSAHFSIGRGGREVRYRNIEICVIDQDIPVLIGIKPLFDTYKVIIQAYENKFILEPSLVADMNKQLANSQLTEEDTVALGRKITRKAAKRFEDA